MAGLPVLASNLETFDYYIEKYKIGLTVNPDNIKAIAQSIKWMLADELQLEQWRINARRASKVLNWDNESIKMNQIYEKIRS